MSTESLHFVKKRSYQRIAKDRAVRLKYAVFDQRDASVIEYRDDLYYLHGGYGGAFPAVETALEGKGVGDTVELELSPAQAYGERDESLSFDVPAATIPAEAQRVGARLDGEGPDGTVRAFTVLAVQDGWVRVDGNHPLAGRELRFIFEVLDVREAHRAELEAGYAFPPQ